VPDQGAFCPHCGSTTGREAESTAAVGPAGEVDGSDEGSAGYDPEVQLPIPENIAAIIAYITILPAVVFLYLEPFKRNLFVRFHAFQHLFLFVAGLAFGTAAAILWAVLQLIPFMRVLVFPFTGLIGLAWFFLWLLLLVKAYHHEVFKLPVIGDLAEDWSRK
jgi:uncharacterized membrane protein